MHDHDDTEIFDRGLQFDLSTLLDRRRLLGLFAGAGLAAVAGCSAPSSAPTSSAPTSAAPASASSGGGTRIPEETAGPYPGDGSNGPNILSQTGIVRQDIRSSFGTGSAVAQGIPLTISFTVLKGTSPLAGGAVYVWHCDREGRYSMYSDGATDQNYLRGVQEIAADGQVSFTSIFPACYAGRWPHVHFEVYPSLAQATNASSKIATSQIALPKQICDAVYATSGYEQSVRNLSQVSLERDMVFSDGYANELGTITGSVGSDLTVNLSVQV
jgi:protocatechuate 3,4-dioxygenase beta subunit